MIVGFGKAFIAVVSEQLGPPLKQVAQYINEWVLPAFTTFRNEVAGKQLDAIKTWGSTLISFLGPVLKWCAEFITGTVLPAIKSLTQTWIENRERIMPIIDAMIFFGKVVGIIIGIVLILIGAGVFGALVGMFYLVAGVAKVVIGALAYVGDAFRVLMSIINSVIFWFRMLYQEVRDRIAGVLDIIRSLPMTIRNNLGNMDDLLLSAGRAVINGLINGIKQQIPSLGGVLSGIGGFIQDHKGPLDYDRRLLIPAGRAIMGGLMRGINDQMPALLDQINGINSTINLSTGQDSEGNSFRRPGLKPSGPPIVNKYYNIEQNITTQEISPRRTATQLGWEVTTVI
jgi:phage-related protein